jgi:hypothetical protein
MTRRREILAPTSALRLAEPLLGGVEVSGLRVERNFGEILRPVPEGAGLVEVGASHLGSPVLIEREPVERDPVRRERAFGDERHRCEASRPEEGRRFEPSSSARAA